MALNVLLRYIGDDIFNKFQFLKTVANIVQLFEIKDDLVPNLTYKTIESRITVNRVMRESSGQ